MTNNSPEDHYNAGTTLLMRGDIRGGLKELDQAIKLRPGYSKALHNRGSAYSALRMFDLAISDYTRVAELASHDANLQSDAICHRGMAYCDKGDTARGIEDFDRAIALNAKCVDAYVWRGDAYLKTHRIELARRDLQRAIELDPSIVRASDEIAAVFQSLPKR